MKRKIIILTLTFFLLVGCSTNKETKQKSNWQEKISFVKIDEPRMEIEKKLSQLLNTENNYNMYGDNINVEKTYKLDETWELYVKYEGGAPAPWADGKHYPPVDSHVTNYEIRKITKKSKKSLCDKNSELSSSNMSAVCGNIGMYKGNCMPGPDSSPCKPGGKNAILYFTKQSEKYDPNLLIKMIETDESGYYESEFSPGEFSLFIYDTELSFYNCKTNTTCDENGAFACDSWTSKYDESGKYAGTVCMPISLKVGDKKIMNANLDHAAW